MSSCIVKIARASALTSTAFLLLVGTAARAADEELDPEVLALTWHKISGAPFDFDRAVNLSPKVAGPATFDTPDIKKQELARLQAIHDAGSKSIEFTTVVNGGFEQYDHDRGEFPIGLFQPGIYLSYKYHYADYRLVFANGDAARALSMPNKEEARAFDQNLKARRPMNTVVRFRLIGTGDPQGAVGGDRVMRGELLSVKVVDRNEQVVYAPDIKPFSEEPPKKFVASEVDIAGMRVGVDAGEFKSALERLYSADVERVDAKGKGGMDTRYAGYLEIDLLTCMGGGYRRRAPAAGDVCVRAYFDDDEVIRTIIMLRVFPWMEIEPIRAAAIARYGTVAQSAGAAYIGWGPTVDPKLLSYKFQDGYAITMNVNSPSDLMGGNYSRPLVIVALQLIDPEWAANAKPLR